MLEPRRSAGEQSELLYVVMPVYNEQVSVAGVVREWAKVLNQLALRWVLLAVDDGSTDGTPAELESLREEVPNLETYSKRNGGHGQACVEGYQLAVAKGAAWVLQIDSDGQCDPRYFPELWRRRQRFAAVFGARVSRDDGAARSVISWCCRLATRAATGVRVRDPNVPYRLMRADVLAQVLSGFPSDFRLANVLVAVVLQKGLAGQLAFVEIGFRDRAGGQPSVKWTRFVSEGVKLCWALLGAREFAGRRADAVAIAVRA
ncbi:MAG TPA: glycosyltransferase family 2 protein [Polyangiaceae bacterium]|nr:glycosyltransferase family 2 protein [Polyangiaceae bacterium]